MKKKKILIIEDEPGQILMMQTRLEAAGFEVISATDGESGLDMAGKENPDLIVLDIMMPEIDGYGVANILKQSPETKEIPILVVTAVGTPNAEEMARACGADDFLKKPYDSKLLIEKIKKMI